MSDEPKGLVAAPIQHKLPWDEQDTFAKKNPDTGLVEVIHIPSGKVVAVIGEPDDLSSAAHGFQKIVTPDGDTVFLQVGVPMEYLPSHRNKFTYSSVMADLICEKIAEGALITKISKQEGMPSYSTIRHWIKTQPSFAEKIALAYKDRAEYFSDLATDTAMELQVHNEYKRNAVTGELELVKFKSDADSTSAARAKMDLLLKQAAVGNQDRFGNKTKVTNDHTGQVTFVIETGIRREGDANFFVDESKKIRDAIAPGQQILEAKKVTDE